MKKNVIAYLHTHWDREWYREFEVFRLRLVRVFDNVLDMLQQNKIPSFYFDGQVVALLDYLKIRPENENLVRKFIKEKRLFIGPFYCLVDEFLTDKICFEKNLQIGLKIAKEFGCEDFIGYLADTFGHSKNIPQILKKYGIDEIMVWRGVGDLPADFVFNGVNTVNLVRGYFNDIFSAKISIKDKVNFLKKNLDLIAEKSSDYLLLPIGADHLGIENDIAEQVEQVNNLLDDYKIVLSSPFEYFNNVKFKTEFNDELRDNSKTFILPGSYSARRDLKQYNTKCSYLLNQADKLQQHYGSKYTNVIEYAYKMLLKNQAHDSICGCSTDLVHKENIIRYEKVLQIANTIIEELRLEYKFSTPFMKSSKIIDGYEAIDTYDGFENSLLYDTQRIPVTEDYTKIYTLQKKVTAPYNINISVKNNKLYINNTEIIITRRNDLGDTYNFAPDKEIKVAKVLELKGNVIKTDFFDIHFRKSENLINFKIEWMNNLENKLWQIRFVLPKPVTETYSEDLNCLIKRTFDCDYNMADNLPQERGKEAKTNFAPMQRFLWSQDLGVITKGLTEYEVYKNTLAITILRSTGIISNPKNPARTTPAGPPIKVFDAQLKGLNTVEFSAGFFNIDLWEERLKEVYPDFI